MKCFAVPENLLFRHFQCFCDLRTFCSSFGKVQFGEHFGDTCFHLTGSFVGEGKGEDGIWSGTQIEEGDVADDQCKGFAASGACFVCQRGVKCHHMILLQIFW